ncbi:hypothetical protein PG997_000964 [Apiospora hydei]|uniref:Uncharacterized protein n=1 Tax=Apiospora hydei TaxID=1337664 RepID=A0ABR1XCE9_9PEZI
MPSENEYDAIIMASHKLRIATLWAGRNAKASGSATDDIGVRSNFQVQQVNRRGLHLDFLVVSNKSWRNPAGDPNEARGRSAFASFFYVVVLIRAGHQWISWILLVGAHGNASRCQAMAVLHHESAGWQAHMHECCPARREELRVDYIGMACRTDRLPSAKVRSSGLPMVDGHGRALDADHMRQSETTSGLPINGATPSVTHRVAADQFGSVA